MKKEDRLLILFARCELTKSDISQITELLNDNLDWGYIVLNSLFNRTASMLYEHLVSNKLLNYVQDKIYLLYRTYYTYYKRRQLKSREEFTQVIKCLNENDIKYAVLKGIALCDKAYSRVSIFMREFGDLDVLVIKEHVAKVEKIIRDLGYVQGEYDIYTGEVTEASRRDILFFRMLSHQTHEYIKRCYEDKYVGNTGTYSIDINFSILEGDTGNKKISTEKLMENLQKVYIDRDNFYLTLENELFLLQLCTHLYRDAYSAAHKVKFENVTLLKFCDIREFILSCGNNFDWRLFLDISRKYNIENETYFTLYFTEYIYKDLNLQEILKALNPCNPEFDKEIHNMEKNIYNEIFTTNFSRKSKNDNMFDFAVENYTK